MYFLLRFLLTLLVSFYSNLISAETHNSYTYQDSADQWALHIVENLKEDKTQVLANVIYLCYANALIEEKINLINNTIGELYRSIKSLALENDQLDQEIAALKTLLERLSFFVMARSIYTQKLQTCVKYYNQNTNLIASQAIAHLQYMREKALNQEALAKKDHTSALLARSSEMLSQQIPVVNALAHLYKDLASGEYDDYFNTAQETKDISSIALIDEVLKNNAIAQETADLMIKTLNVSKKYAQAMISSVSNDMYKIYYTALYNKISTETFDQHYSTVLFDTDSLLSEKQRTALPSADQIYHHIVKTVESYNNNQEIII